MTGSAKKPPRTLQIATVGDSTDEVLLGIRNFPAHKLALICTCTERKAVSDFAEDMERTLKVPVEVHPIEGDPFEGVLRTVSSILRKERAHFEEVLLNVSGGTNELVCAAIVTAFVSGLKAFQCTRKRCTILPILKISYAELVSKTKLEILRAISKVGGEVGSLEELKAMTAYGKPLLSYHIRGTKDSLGLAELGLVEVERSVRGKSKIRLTAVGKILIDRLDPAEVAERTSPRR